MTARKKSAGKKKRSAKKRAAGSAKKRRQSSHAVIDTEGRASPYARMVQQVFEVGVQRALGRMARNNVEAAVIVDGQLVRAVPQRLGGRFVVREAPPSRSRLK